MKIRCGALWIVALGLLTAGTGQFCAQAQNGAVPAEQTESTNDIAFAFPGGTPSEFVDAVRAQLKVSWAGVAEIPKEMSEVRIPVIRLRRDSLRYFMQPSVPPPSLVEALIMLYNRIGQQKPELGRLVVEGDPSKPAVVLFVAGQSTMNSSSQMSVRAFPLRWISRDQWKMLEEFVAGQLYTLRDTQIEAGSLSVRNGRFRISISPETSLLVVQGTEAFLDATASIVSAWQTNNRAVGP